MNERIRPVYKKKKTIDVGRETVDSISVAPIAKSIFRERGFPEATLLDKTDGKSRPPPPPSPPKSRMEKWRVLAFARLHPWFGGGMGVCCSILFLLTDCVYHHVKGNSILSKSSKDSTLFIQPRLSINLTVRQGIRENWHGRFFLILERPFNW